VVRVCAFAIGLRELQFLAPLPIGREPEAPSPCRREEFHGAYKGYPTRPAPRNPDGAVLWDLRSRRDRTLDGMARQAGLFHVAFETAVFTSALAGVAYLWTGWMRTLRSLTRTVEVSDRLRRSSLLMVTSRSAVDERLATVQKE